LSSFVQKVVQHISSDRHDTDLEDHTVVIRKMQSVSLYSTAWYRLYFEQYIDGYIINVFLLCQIILCLKLAFVYPIFRNL